jgi:hypothetical protein
VEGEAQRNRTGLLQALDNVDLGIFTGRAPEAAPKRGIIGSRSWNPLSKVLAVST